ncbi:tRNA (guanosine(46)-N7)-methyltransferase TrmB [soil metagenome]
MGKNKLQRYADNVIHENVFEHTDFDDQETPAGRWAAEIFGNSNPVVVELACGKGDYTTSLAEKNPGKNYIGIDIKGDRIWKGARRAIEKNLENVRFLRCYIDHLYNFFAKNEISEFWITFPDPYLKKTNEKKRLTSHKFLSIYRKVAMDEAVIHLKTDSTPLFRFTESVIAQEGLRILNYFDDLYKQNPDDEILSIKTYYEKKHLKEGRTIQFVSFTLNT